MFVAAESTGRTVELDLASLETVMAGARELDPRLYLSVNLSPRTLETEAFNPYELLALAPALRHRRHADRRGADGARGGRGPGPAAVARSALRRHGVRTAADDVGAGNAGLRLLSGGRVRRDEDRPVAGAGWASSGTSDAVLRALGDLALRRHQTIVAEGVETPEQLEVVMGLGFDSAQGYLLQRPGPALNAVTLDLPALAGHPRRRPTRSRRPSRRRCRLTAAVLPPLEVPLAVPVVDDRVVLLLLDARRVEVVVDDVVAEDLAGRR